MIKIELRNRKNQKIIGVLEKPEGDIIGTSILEHGWGGSKERPTMQALKRGFLDSGFQTFNFDATNSFNESDGDFEKSTMQLHYEDFEDVAKWTQKQEWFIGPMALGGHSKGGYAVVRYAEEYSNEVNYVISIAPVVSGKLSFEAHERKEPGGIERWKKEEVIEEVSKNGQTKRKHWFQMEERLAHDLLPKADKLIMPILLIVGSEDTSCPPDHTKILYDKIASNKKEIKIIDGALHSFQTQDEVEICKTIVRDWLKSLK